MANMSTASARRQDYIDNLRSTMIFLVVAMHAAVTYSHVGGWYYKSDGAVDLPSTLVFVTFQFHLQAFFMGFLFLLAGYFTPTAYDRKGFWRFLWDRFMRLGLPSLLYIFLIHDMMGHYLLGWHGSDPFWPSYVYYLTHWDWIDGTGPMWFAVALLFFSLVYALIRLIRPRAGAGLPMPGIAVILLVGALIGIGSFLVRLKFPVGSNFHNMQFGYFTQYVVLFAVGILARRGDWLAHFPARTGYRLLAGALIALPFVWVGLLVLGGAMTQGTKAYDGGWHWQALAIALWEQMFCVAICTGLLVLYRERIKGGGWLSKLLRANSFAIYVFHPPVLVAISLALVSLAWPPLAMFALVTVLAFAATLAVAMVARRVPLLKSIL